ncbi:MAG: GrpB family protein [Candidatus Omnitrophica bacterium]|nr:GrpB family protein [Candidatus Omnitrophota bacterium]
MASKLQKKEEVTADFNRKELGEKYPIVVVKYDPAWAELYRAEVRFLKSRFGPEVISRIEHFGSTAVPGSAAKPVIDILVEVTSFKTARSKIIPELKSQGYDYTWVANQPKPPGHMMFMKGYGIEGAERLRYHLHAAPANHPLWDRLFFRDYLRRHPETVRRYEKLKRRLAKLHRNDREAYTEGKADFVKKITDKAKKS